MLIYLRLYENELYTKNNIFASGQVQKLYNFLIFKQFTNTFLHQQDIDCIAEKFFRQLPYAA